MRVIILAAGRGSRLKSLTEKKPKSLIKINKKTILQHQLDIYKKCGINKIAIVTGYKKNLFDKFEIKKFNNKNWNKTNMVYSLIKAKHWLKNYNCIVSYSDILIGKETIQDLIKAKYKLTLPYNLNWKKNWKLRYSKPLSDLETFRINKNQDIIDIGNQAKTFKEIQGQFMGLLKFTPHAWNRVNFFLNKQNEKKENMQMTQLVQKIIKKKILKVKGIPIKDQWFEVDNFNDYLVAKKHYKEL